MSYYPASETARDTDEPSEPSRESAPRSFVRGDALSLIGFFEDESSPADASSDE